MVGSDGVATGRTAYVTFKDPKALEIALLLSVWPLALIGLIYNNHKHTTAISVFMIAVANVVFVGCHCR
jgi:hypothetical protein